VLLSLERGLNYYVAAILEKRKRFQWQVLTEAPLELLKKGTESNGGNSCCMNITQPF